MGLFDFLKGKKAPAPEPEPEVEPVAAVAILRSGMSKPDEAFAEAILRQHFPEALDRNLPQFRLSQPVWFKAEFRTAGLRTVAEALAGETGTVAESATWILCEGPGGAPSAIVLLRK